MTCVFTLSAMGSSFASVHDRWLLTDTHMSSGASFSGSSQPTRSWQTAQCTKPICCLSNCYFGSTLDFPHITGSDKTLVMQVKWKTLEILFIHHHLSFHLLSFSSFSLQSSSAYCLLCFMASSSPFLAMDVLFNGGRGGRRCSASW